MTTPSRESLLASIRPGMSLDRDFFLKVYGYSVTRPGFKYEVFERLGRAGYDRLYEFYIRYVTEYEEQERQAMKEAAAWLVNQKRKDDVRMKRNNEEVGEWQDLQRMSDRQLLNLLQELDESGQL